ncbi:MAG: hypothetical protein ACE1ZY_04175, partial [Alphaproteobacteria bacterium]
EASYEVEREKQNKKGAWKGRAIVGTTGADVIFLIDTSGKGTFRYRVRALNGFGFSAWTAYLKVIVTSVSGGGGGGKGGGKPCNPKKETCPGT